MKLEYSPALQSAHDRARYFAQRDAADAVTPRNVLCAMLEEVEGKASTLLVHAGADLQVVRERFGLPASFDAAPPELEMHLSMRSVLALARELASIHGDEGSIATDHFLLAILEVDESIRDELAACGMDYGRLQKTIVGDTPPLAMDEPLLLQEPTEELNIARILDANANRAREALRVLEDFARFTLADAVLSACAKQLRHDFADAIRSLSAPLLLASRDTLGDVGTAISTAAEWSRPSLAAVVQANAKRLQESLRSLEEYGKVVSVEFAQRVEKLRYQAYTLERAIVQGIASRDRLSDARLYVLVTDTLCRASLVGTVKEAALGGAQIVQLREKGIDDRSLLERARLVREVTRSAGIPFIVNDRPDIARLAQADGVHLGQDDMPIHDARRILGPDAIIGVSTHNLDQVRKAVLEGANYIGVGPTFPSKTKEFEGFAGLDFVRQAFAATTLPAFAIGGINVDNVAEVVAAGARAIAVSHAICASEDPRRNARRLRQAIDPH